MITYLLVVFMLLLLLLLGSTYTATHLDNIVSSFSMLIANLRATNGKQHSMRTAPLYVKRGLVGPAYCNTVIGAHHIVNEVYNNSKKEYQCGNSKNILLPMECPYWNKTTL